MKRLLVLVVASIASMSLLAVSGGSAADNDNKGAQAMSGTAELRDVELGSFLTECPQAGKGLDPKPKPLDRRAKDEVEKKSEGGDDRRECGKRRSGSEQRRAPPTRRAEREHDRGRLDRLHGTRRSGAEHEQQTIRHRARQY
jgi:hypothetical protein